MIIKADKFYLENNVHHGYVKIENGKFHTFLETVPDDEEIINYEDCVVLPGFIDIHTHGYQGYHAQSIKTMDLVNLKKVMAEVGVTGFLPTAGAHFDLEYTNLEALSKVIGLQASEVAYGSKILGIHMEGPFLNMERRGAFQPSQLLQPSIEKLEEYLKASHNNIVYMALAPEVDPDGAMINYLKEHNIVVAAAHTTATFDQFQKGVQQGISVSTHTGNGMLQIDRREVGALGAALLNDDIYCEIICDFHHVDPKMIELMFRVKKDGCSKFIMISDSTEVSGLPTGKHQSDGMEVTILENGLILDENKTIMGSAHNLLYGYKNLKQKMHLPVADILLMTSLNPAKVLNLEATKGSIKIGKDADFIVLNKDDVLQATYVEGECVYKIA